MEANEEFGLEEVVITSNLPDKLNACFKKGIRDLQFKGMPDKYYNCSMARVHDSQYLMNVRTLRLLCRGRRLFNSNKY